MTMFSLRSFVPVLLVLLLTACSADQNGLSTDEFLETHIGWLADEQREGRLAGTAQEAAAANYIQDRFEEFGLIPAGDDNTYLQKFTLTGPMPQAMGVDNHLSRNVIGKVRGTDRPEQYIIVGAHYDGQGRGGPISMNHGGEPAIHPSADDNASGTAGLMHLARTFSDSPPETSVLFIAFSGEELGLLGSRYFAGRMDVPRDPVLAMINLDMIGRLDDGDLTIFGTGTSPEWEPLLDTVSHDSLSVRRAASGSGASDHASFYEIGIPVLHYFSGTHDEYHMEGDTADLINIAGMTWILDHTEQVIRNLAGKTPGEISFTRTESGRGSIMPTDGVTLGVIPDYTWDEGGFRIERVREGSSAEEAGLQDGDVIIGMDEHDIADIYDYMEVLEKIEAGDEVRIVARRSGETVELTVRF
jgi:hypothetical protein